MKIIDPQFTVAKTKQSAKYLETNAPNLTPIAAGVQQLASGIGNLGNTLMQLDADAKAKQNQLMRFQATSSLVDYNTNVALEQEELRKNAAPNDPNFARKATDTYLNREAEFIKTLPEDLREEFKMRVSDTRARVILGAKEFQDKQLETHYSNEVAKRGDMAAKELAEKPETLEQWRTNLHKMIDEADISETSRVELRQKTDEYIEKQAYRATVKQTRMMDVQYTNELTSAVRQAAEELGVDPLDLMTIISYETGGKLSTSTRGGAGNRHIGLIQFGEQEQRDFGAYQGQPVGEQVAAVVRFLKARGFKPGMSFAQLYATINAGNPGGLNASDASSGGMPGTVLDKVNSREMALHRQKAAEILGGTYIIPDSIDDDPRFSHVAYEDRLAARNDATREANSFIAQMQQERKTQTDTFNNNLYNCLLSGNCGMKDIEDAIANGQLQDYDDRSKALKIYKDKQKDAEDLALFTRKVSLNQILDPTDVNNKKGMNLLFGAAGETALNNRDERYVKDVLAPLFEKTQMLPPDAVGMLGTLLNSNDARQMMFAAAALNDLEQINPVAYAAQVNETARAQADRWESLRGVMEEKQLIETLRGPRTTQERQALNSLREDAKKILTSTNNAVTFESVADVFGGVLPGGIKGRMMEREWQQLFIENYAATGGMSVEKANEITIKQLQRVWGVTQFNGVSTIMRHPVEKHFPAVNGSWEYITHQARGELGLLPEENPILVSDAQTETEVNSGQPPSYVVMVEKDGVIQPVMDNSQPYRITFAPTELDKKLNEQSARIKQKENEYSYYLNILGATGAGAPTDLIEEANKVKEELDALRKEGTAIDAVTQVQYEGEASKRLAELQLQFKPINDALMSWTEPAEDFPQIKEWEKLYDEIETLKFKVKDEAKMRRQKTGVE